MTRHIALLRGINVGRNRKVEMARLRALMGELGYADVATYVQSGNIVFRAPGQPPAQLERHLQEQLAATFGFDIAVMVRSRDELAAVVHANPFRGVATDPSRQVVLFLADAIDPARLADIDADEYAPEAFRVLGRELHVWAPGGIGTSPLLKVLSERRLGVAATSRNWRTVEKLLALADDEA
jgi:uncharacterized protein (DUF1697 family)